MLGLKLNHVSKRGAQSFTLIHGSSWSGFIKLNMSTARWRPKSPWSLSGTSTHHTMVTQSNYHGHEWTTHIPFVPCQLAVTFLRWRYFKLLPRNFKVKVMGVVEGQGHTVCPLSYQFASFSFHTNQTNNSSDTAISKSKAKVMSEVKGQGHKVYQVSNQCTCFFRFTSIGPTFPEIWPTECLTLKKHIQNFLKKIHTKKFSHKISPKSNQLISMTRGTPHFEEIGWLVLTSSCR